MSPGVNRGSGGGARGCGFEERVGVHARTGGIRFHMASLCVCGTLNDGFFFKKRAAQKAARLPRRVAESTPRPKGRWPSYARRRALPVYGSDNPRRAKLYTGF